MQRRRARWSPKEHPGRFALLVIVFILIGALVGGAWGVLSDKALGAEPAARCVTLGGDLCPTVTTRHKRTATRLREGRCATPAGSPPSRVFKRPAYAKWF